MMRVKQLVAASNPGAQRVMFIGNEGISAFGVLARDQSPILPTCSGCA